MNDKMTEELIDRLRAMYVANGTNYVQAAADKLEAQAERIKVLELDLDVQAGSIDAAKGVNARQAERIKELEGQLDDATAAARTEQMIAETAQAAASRLLTERDALHAQLAEIAASDPVAWAISYDGVTPYTLWHEGDGALLDCEVKRQGGTTQKMPLFTRPMPAQDVTELVELREWRDKTFEAYPNIDLDIEALSKYKGAK